MSGSRYLDSIGRQARLAVDAPGRPWPLPEAPWAQAQTRTDVLFAHWPVPFAELARLIPPELSLDTFDGEAWLGLVACRVGQHRLRGVPPLPGLSSALQLEVQTYVTLDDRPGIWICSTESSNPALVEAAKRTHRLPSQRARLAAFHETGTGAMRFEAERGGLELRAAWTAGGPAVEAMPGSFEAFACERFSLYTADGGRVYRADIHHAPWMLQAASVSFEALTLSPVELDGPARVCFAAEQDVLLWPLEEL